jgi:hypothetical protein
MALRTKIGKMLIIMHHILYFSSFIQISTKFEIYTIFWALFKWNKKWKRITTL